ncbi:hypothetical protein D3C78_1269520 [compost metagenome]
MHVIQIDHLNSQTLQRSINCLTNVLRAIIQTPVVWRPRIARVTEFGGDQSLCAMPGQEWGKQLFVGAEPIHVCGIEHVHPQLQSSLERCQSLTFIRLPVELTHAHATEPLTPNHHPATQAYLRNQPHIIWHEKPPNWLRPHVISVELSP